MRTHFLSSLVTSLGHWHSRLLFLFLLVAVPSTTGADVNYDESKVPSYQLPDPLRMEDGRSVTNAAMWYRARRPELLKLFQSQVYGKPMARPNGLVFRTRACDPQALQGTAVRYDMEAELGTNGTLMIFCVLLPSNQTNPVPVFAGLHLFDTHQPDPRPAVARQRPGASKPTPQEHEQAGRETLRRILNRGYGILSLNTDPLAPDSLAHYWEGAARWMGRDHPGAPSADEAGALAIWAWGLSRVLDYCETQTAINAKRVIAIGHSRMGKCALWAAAEDERFAMAISNDSGCGGAALNKRIYGETVDIITRAFPYWFCGNFLQYANHEDLLPVDQHELLALIAPRPVYVASAVEDRWADPQGEFLAALHAAPVYRLLNTDALGVTAMPLPDQPIGGTIGYHVRHGQHDLTDYDWEQYLYFADRQSEKPGR